MRQANGIIGLLLILATPPAIAHHGWGPHYDGDAHITVTGVITEFEFVNPHGFVYLDVVNEVGDIEKHWCEMQSRTQLQRRGITEEHFQVGSMITIEGFASRRDPLGCEFGTGHFHDGTVLMLRQPDGKSVYGAPLAEGDDSIVGTWYPEAFLAEAGSVEDSLFELTVEGEVAHADIDWSTENPTMSCSAGSNIRAWAAPGLPTLIERLDDQIRIRHEFMDVDRTIYLDRAHHADNETRTELGHSIGRFEDGALLIETERFSAGALWVGRLNSEALTTTEKLWVDPESGLLHLDWTATDPAYYADPQRGSRTFIRTDLELSQFDCVPDVGHMKTG